MNTNEKREVLVNNGNGNIYNYYDSGELKSAISYEDGYINGDIYENTTNIRMVINQLAMVY